MLKAALLLIAAALVALSGCGSPSKPDPLPFDAPQTLSPGDVIRVTFPGAPNLEEPPQQIRRDGRINLSFVGEVAAAGRTPAELEQELLKRYASQLVTQDIKVLIVSSTYAVFVSGAVLRPGKITAERALTALEAVMEAGGFDSARANSRKVVVVRQESGQTKNYIVNLKAVLDGKSSESFYLKSHDIVYVPEKFNWF